VLFAPSKLLFSGEIKLTPDYESKVGGRSMGFVKPSLSFLRKLFAKIATVVPLK
jgi:hypothetical protein